MFTMNIETRECQNCKTKFRIEPEDFLFYEKMNVPPPTFRPECRLERRLMFRNERNLYRRKCDLCGKDIITTYSPDKPFKVYCSPCWWSDKWDASEYAMEYDPNRNFFDQFRELEEKVPHMQLIVDYSTNVNSDYVSHTGYMKDCYFVFETGNAENCYYLSVADSVKDCIEGYVIEKSELSYDNINIRESYNVYFSEGIESSHTIYFSKNLTGCSDCFGCINLRNRHYYIFNEPYHPDEYKKKLEEYNIGSFRNIERIREEATKFWLKFPHKFFHGVHNVNSSGDYLYNNKNTHDSYIVSDGENLKFTQLLTEKGAKDSYDYTEWGRNAEKLYECVGVGAGANTIRMCSMAWDNIFDIEYSMTVISSSHIFGCVGVRKKEYCILNKQYAKEEYEKLRTRIIQDMNERPYVDAKGRKFTYGEFFPYDLSLFDYNESTAQDYFSLSQEAILECGWRWKEKEDTRYQSTKHAEELPDHIKDIDDSITKEIIECASCKKAYRIIPQELDLLRRFGLPIPRKCFECRYKARLARMNPMRSYDRICAKCGTPIRTSYAPERLEIIYCEQCFQDEVV